MTSDAPFLKNWNILIEVCSREEYAPIHRWVRISFCFQCNGNGRMESSEALLVKSPLRPEVFVTYECQVSKALDWCKRISNGGNVGVC